MIDVERDTMFLQANQSLGLADRPLPQKQALALKYFCHGTGTGTCIISREIALSMLSLKYYLFLFYEGDGYSCGFVRCQWVSSRLPVLDVRCFGSWGLRSQKGSQLNSVSQRHKSQHGRRE